MIEAFGRGGITFHEVLVGSMRAKHSHPVRAQAAVTFASGPLDTFLENPLHPGKATGTVSIPGIGTHLPIRGGTIRLMIPDSSRPGVRLMTYDLPFTGEDGRQRLAHGQKTLDGSVHVWRQTTRLETQVYLGDRVDPSKLEYTGWLKLSVPEFAKELASFRTTEAPTVGEKVSALARFFAFFGLAVAKDAAEAFRPSRSRQPGGA